MISPVATTNRFNSRKAIEIPTNGTPGFTPADVALPIASTAERQLRFEAVDLLRRVFAVGATNRFNSRKAIEMRQYPLKFPVTSMVLPIASTAERQLR